VKQPPIFPSLKRIFREGSSSCNDLGSDTRP
jgi:hypothetical protein